MPVAHGLICIPPFTILACSLLPTLAFALLFFSPFLISHLQRGAATSWSCDRQSHAPQPLYRKGASPLPRLRHTTTTPPIVRALAITRMAEPMFPTRLGQSTIHTIDSSNIRTVTPDSFADYEKGVNGPRRPNRCSSGTEPLTLGCWSR